MRVGGHGSSCCKSIIAHSSRPVRLPPRRQPVRDWRPRLRNRADREIRPSSLPFSATWKMAGYALYMGIPPCPRSNQMYLCVWRMAIPAVLRLSSTLLPTARPRSKKTVYKTVDGYSVLGSKCLNGCLASLWSDDSQIVVVGSIVLILVSCIFLISFNAHEVSSFQIHCVFLCASHSATMLHKVEVFISALRTLLDHVFHMSQVVKILRFKMDID